MLMNTKNPKLVCTQSWRQMIVCTACLVAGSSTISWASEPLHFVEAIPLPGVEGRIDHMALDTAGQRLLVAALGNNTVEIVDLAAHKVVHSIRGLREPQGVAFLRDMSQIAVANGEGGSVRFFDAKSYRATGGLDFQSDA